MYSVLVLRTIYVHALLLHTYGYIMSILRGCKTEQMFIPTWPLPFAQSLHSLLLLADKYISLRRSARIHNCMYVYVLLHFLKYSARQEKLTSLKFSFF